MIGCVAFSLFAWPPTILEGLVLSSSVHDRIDVKTRLWRASLGVPGEASQADSTFCRRAVEGNT